MRQARATSRRETPRTRACEGSLAFSLSQPSPLKVDESQSPVWLNEPVSATRSVRTDEGAPVPAQTDESDRQPYIALMLFLLLMLSALLIREGRLRAGLTQCALAGRLGVAQSQVARWERGRTTPSLECQRPFEIPHGRPGKVPGHGHRSPRIWPPNSPRGNGVSHLPRGFTPLPLVASCRRIDSPDVCTTWA